MKRKIIQSPAPNIVQTAPFSHLFVLRLSTFTPLANLRHCLTCDLLFSFYRPLLVYLHLFKSLLCYGNSFSFIYAHFFRKSKQGAKGGQVVLLNKLAICTECLFYRVPAHTSFIT
jgi:hypothetical protein